MQVTQNYSDAIVLVWNRVLSRAVVEIQAIFAIVSLWRSRYQERRALKKLDDRMLNDIGITRDQALEEANKPFWVGPSR